MDEVHQAVLPSLYNRIWLKSLAVNKMYLSLINHDPGRSYLNIEEDEKLARFFLSGNKIT